MVLLTYSFVESKDLVVTRFPIMVSIIHLSLIGWPLLSIVSQQFTTLKVINLRGIIQIVSNKFINLIYVLR